MCEEYNMVNVNYGDWMRCRTFLLRKNNKWIDVSIPKITSVWDTIKYEREKMVTVTEPKRRIKNYYFGPVIEETLDKKK
jgi:hypothetical protein